MEGGKAEREEQEMRAIVIYFSVLSGRFQIAEAFKHFNFSFFSLKRASVYSKHRINTHSSRP